LLIFSNIESIIFFILILISAFSTLFLGSRIFKVIKSGKPEQNPRFNRIPERLIRVVKEVLFQQRVLNGRPFVGLMHFAVFAAFVLYSLETISMIFEPFGFHLSHIIFGQYLSLFRNILTIFSFLCLAGIFGLFIRRFLFKSYSPDPKSYESGFVAVLIAVLMLTYLDQQLLFHFLGIAHIRIIS